MESSEPKFNITITGGTIIKGLIIIALFYILFLLRDVVLIILLAIVIASAIEPAIKWFGKYKLKRLLSAIFVYLVLILALIGIIAFFVPNVLAQASSYLAKLPSDFSLSDLWRPIQESRLGQLAPNIPVREVVEELRHLIAGTSDSFIKTAGAIFGGLFSFILIIVLSFYLAVQEDGVGSFLRTITPQRSRAYVIDLWKRSQTKIGYWMQGQIILAVMVGVLSYLGLLVLGIEHALLLATLAGLFEIIPVFGPILSAIPAIIVGTIDGGVNGGILVLLLYVLIQQFENHLLYPLVVKKVIGISPVLVIIALVVGGKLAGFMGLLLAIPISAVIMEFYMDLERHRKQAEDLAEKVK